jgi:uncharacterized Zn-binding protein involved in type VI secretion
MSKPFIVLGDKTSHGGRVIQAAPTTDINGTRIARVGDKVTCPVSGHGPITFIATGDSNCVLEGSAAARHGDKTACGAILISSQSLTTDI